MHHSASKAMVPLKSVGAFCPAQYASHIVLDAGLHTAPKEGHPHGQIGQFHPSAQCVLRSSSGDIRLIF